MKRNIFYSLMLAVAFLLSGASFASPYTSDLGYASPDYEKFVLAVYPPVTPDFIVTAMASGGSDSETADKNCMAGCNIDERTQIVASFYQSKVTDNLNRTVIACGFESTPIEVPTRIPVAV